MILKYRSFAKLNLFLYVTKKRDDGYHDLFSLMTKIDLCDDIKLDFSSADIVVRCDHPDVPEDESNLAHKAAKLFYQSAADITIKDRGVAIRIIKKIPPGGGLGGGSSNAAIVLSALNNCYNNPFSKTQLMQMGLKLGADVPFFLFDGAAIARGVGEQLEAVENLKPYHLLLCDPGVHSSTAKVYKNIDFRLTENEKYTKNTGLNVPIRGQEFDVRGKLHNDLEESACRLTPKIKNTKEEMSLLLQKNVHMTGSGSSLFALYSDRKDAKKGYELLLKHWRGSSKKIFLSSFT